MFILTVPRGWIKGATKNQFIRPFQRGSVLYSAKTAPILVRMRPGHCAIGKARRKAETASAAAWLGDWISQMAADVCSEAKLRT